MTNACPLVARYSFMSLRSADRLARQSLGELGQRPD